jgi:Zn-dependent protease
VSLRPTPRTLTVARVQAIEIAVHWRWLAVLLLCTWLLAHDVLPARFPLWEQGTAWLTSAAVVLAGEVALLLHELSHAFLARTRGQQVTRIVFHGLQAETVVAPHTTSPGHDALIALVGPGVNLALAAIVAALRLGFHTDGPLDLVLLCQVIGNLAMAIMSLVPVGNSDGARVLRALRS